MSFLKTRCLIKRGKTEDRSSFPLLSTHFVPDDEIPFVSLEVSEENGSG